MNADSSSQVLECEITSIAGTSPVEIEVELSGFESISATDAAMNTVSRH